MQNVFFSPDSPDFLASSPSSLSASSSAACGASPLLHGDVRPLIFALSAPSMGAMLASALCALLDALLLSRMGAQVTAAVGLALPLLTLIQAVGFTLGMGAGSLVSRSLGRGDGATARCATSVSLMAAALLGGLLCASGFAFVRPLMRLLGAEDATLSPAVSYAHYVLASGPLLCVSLVLSSLLRGQGRSRDNLIACASGAALGLTLQVCLIGALGIAGAGISMLAREALTLVLLLRFALRPADHSVRPSLRACRPSLSLCADIMRSGLPTLLRQGLMSLSGVLLSRISAGFGAATLAGVGLASRVLSLLSAGIIGFGQGFQPVCGYAYGAGHMARVREAYVFCQRAAVCTLLVLGAALFALSRPLLLAFGVQEDVVQLGTFYLRAQCVTLFAQGAVVLMNMLTQAMGLTVRASLVATSRQGFVLIPLLLFLPRRFEQTGLLLCQSVSDLLSLGICLLLTRGVFAVDSASCPHYNSHSTGMT